MNRALLVGLLLWVTPAQACHHYARWYYPYPQPRCGVAARGSDPNDHSWSVEITKLPPSWNLDSDREQGIEQLKTILK